MGLCQKIGLACLLLLAGNPLALGQEPAAAPESAPGPRVLGEISFPTGTSVPAAQAAFEQGMLLLHLFEYNHAREQFRRAQELDPGLAMAYWGEAMTHNHPIWNRQDQQAGRAALARLGPTPRDRLERTPVAREQGLLAAVELLYGEGGKAERDRAYMQAMERLAAEFPEDHEVQLFYALALFGVQAGVRDTATYMLCTAIAQGVFSDNPRHPGAAHYLIHGVDDPVHAVLGLQAARALAAMAPDAGHAQHMASHIFLALGMWDDTVRANQAALRVQNDMRQEHGLPVRHWGHYNAWLLYGYLQQGREAEALELLSAAYAEAQAHGKSPEDPLMLDSDADLVGSVVQMWLRYLVETRQWDGPVAEWSFTTGDAYDPNLNISYAKALQAAYGGLAARSSQYLEQFRSLAAGLREALGRQDETAPGDALYLDRLAVMESELEAAVEMARGERAAAIRHAAEASQREGQMPFSFGPPYVDLPSAELLGELLLDAGRFAEAAEAFELQLQRSRLRPRSLEGLATALEALGRSNEAVYHRARLARVRAAAAPPGAD